jgi:hypothetical protein
LRGSATTSATELKRPQLRLPPEALSALFLARLNGGRIPRRTITSAGRLHSSYSVEHDGGKLRGAPRSFSTLDPMMAQCDAGNLSMPNHSAIFAL